MKRVVLSEKAKQEIHEVWWYWAERVSEGVAARQLDRIWAGLGVLAEQPLAGRSAEEIAPGMRVLSVGKYQIYDARRGAAILVAHVIAGERDQRQAVLGK